MPGGLHAGLCHAFLVTYCVRSRWRWGRSCLKVSEKCKSTSTYVTMPLDCRECSPGKFFRLKVS